MFASTGPLRAEPEVVSLGAENRHDGRRNEVMELASQLLSDNSYELTMAMLKGPELREAEAAGSPWPPRLLQEVAICKQGIVVEKLMMQILAGKDRAGSGPGYAFELEGGNSLGFASMGALTMVTMSRPAAHSCLTLHEGFEQRLFVMFLENAELIRAAPEWDSDPLMYASFGIELIANLARVSATLRQSMQQSPSFVPLLEYLVSVEHANKGRPEAITGIRTQTARLMLVLSVSPDCQEWFRISGLVRVIITICETVKPGAKGEAVMACLVALLKMSESSEGLKVLRAQSALLAILKRITKKLSSLCPDLWRPLEGRLFQGQDGSVPAFGAGDKEIWKLARKTGFNGMAVTCSLANCTTKQEYLSGTKFSKCGRCGVAHYCR